MKEQFVPYEQSLQLKELGFDKPCIKGFYNREELYTVVSNPQDFNHRQSKEELVSCPLWQQSLDWFEEKYKLYVTTTPIIWSYDTMELAFKLQIRHIKESNEIVCSETYLEEDLQLETLKQLIRCKENLNL